MLLCVPVPSLLTPGHVLTLIIAIVGTWALPFTAYFAYLSNSVLAKRLQSRQYMGDKLESSSGGRDELQVSTRAQANFVEYVPLAFVLAATAELNGANRQFLNYAMGALFAFRVAHVEFGLRAEDFGGWGRPVGHFGTQGFLAGLAGYSMYLVKGYWGF